MILTKTYDSKIREDEPRYIDCDNIWDVNYWSYKLECSKKELLIAVEEVGPKLDNIYQFIAVINSTRDRRIGWK